MFDLQHDSHTFKGAENFSGARSWYDSLSKVIRNWIGDTGFTDFILALPSEKGRIDYQALHALMKRWSESTHTFQLPFGEFTVDPMSFTAVTGIPCAGDSIPLDAGLHPMTVDRVAYIQKLLGMVPEIKEMHSLKFDSIRAHYTCERVAAATTSREID